MTKQEIFILNRALDGSQIYGMPDFKELRISELLIDTYKEGMIRRGLLKDKGNLTKEGATVVARIKDYKECKKYVSLNNLTIGKNEAGKHVSLMYNPLYDEYKFTRTELSADYKDIIDSYPFFKGIEDIEKKEIGSFTKEEMENKYVDFEKKDSLKVKSHKDGKDLSFVFFARDNKAFMYTYETGILYSIGKNDMNNKLMEVLS